MSNLKILLIVAIVVVAVIVVGAVYYYEASLAPKVGSSIPLTIYVGEVSSTAYGFGNSADTLTSDPGPTITLKTGQTYKMTVNNVGTMQHNWAIVDSKNSAANVLWASAASFINAGASTEVTFKASSAGSYFYICQVPGHVALGLWGTVTVEDS